MSKTTGRWVNKYEGESDDEDYGAGSHQTRPDRGLGNNQGPDRERNRARDCERDRERDRDRDRERERDRERVRDRHPPSTHSSDDSDNDYQAHNNTINRKYQGGTSARHDDGDIEDEIEVITTRVMKRMPSARNDRPAGAFVPKSALPYERPPKARPAFSEEPNLDNQPRGRKERDYERERERGRDRDNQNQNRNSINTDSSSEWVRGGRRTDHVDTDRPAPRKSQQPWAKGGGWVEAQGNYISQGSRDHSPTGGTTRRTGDARRSDPSRVHEDGRRSRDSSAFDDERRRDRREDSVRASRENSTVRRPSRDHDRPRERGDADYDRGDRHPRSSREASEVRQRGDRPGKASSQHHHHRHRYDGSDGSREDEDEEEDREDIDAHSQSSYYEPTGRDRGEGTRYRRGSEEGRNAPIGAGVGSSSAPPRPSPDGHTDTSRTPDTLNSQPVEAFYKVWNPPPSSVDDDVDAPRHAGAQSTALALASAVSVASRRQDAVPLGGALPVMGPSSSSSSATHTAAAESLSADPTVPPASKPSFVLVAHPRGVRCQHIQCTVLRDRHSMHGKLYPQYELILEDPRRTLIVARKMSLNRTSNYHLFDMTRGQAGTKLSKKAGNYLGKLRARTAQRTDYSLLNQKADKEEIAAIGFDKITLLGQLKDGNQPRKMRIVIPQPCAVNGTIDGVNATAYGVDSLHDLMQEVLDRKRILPEGLLLVETKEPVLENGNYRLNFFGRVSLPSVKNFQIVHASNIDNILCQFGKVDEDIFHLDYKAPFNAVQAFALALCQFNL